MHPAAWVHSLPLHANWNWRSCLTRGPDGYIFLAHFPHPLRVCTIGENCHAHEPGFFRLCWAWVPAEALPEAVRRMRAAIDG